MSRLKPRTVSRILVRFTWDRLKVSFWFTPLVMSLGAILLARVMNWVDTLLPNALLQNSYLVLSGSANELRGLLITMATGILATAGVVFSLLTIPLSTVAAQYGSRLLRVYLADRTTQFVLGMYAGTFVYCIIAATSIPNVDTELTYSQVMVSVAVLLMLSATASLIILVQHISTMLQAPNIAAAAGAELREVVRAENLGVVWNDHDQRSGLGEPGPMPDILKTEGYPVHVQHTGYIKYIDLEYLLAFAREKDLVVRLLRRPGQFVWGGVAAARVWPAGQVDGRLDRQVRRAFLVGNHRMPTQDVEYAVNQLAEIAVRATASGIRDPFTAMTCLDQMGDSLAYFISQGEISPNIYDRDGQLRLIIEPVTFAELLSAAFDMLRHNSRDNTHILLHMLDTIDAIHQETKLPGARQELLRHVSMIQAESQAGALIEQDLERIRLRFEALQTKLTEISFTEAP